MKKIVIGITCLLCFIYMGGIAMSSPIAKSWVYATILIENEWGKGGTGFLVFRDTEPGKGRIFLCTNKHIINDSKALRDKASKIICHINVKDKNGKIMGKDCEVKMSSLDGKKRWKEHPDANVDVLAIDITDVIEGIPEMEKRWASYDLFVDDTILSKEDITIGDEIMIVGYPKLYRQGENNLPLVRQGIIATHIGQKYIEEDDQNGNIVRRVIRGFLIDGGVIHGSSGSPVILKPVSGRVVGNTTMLNPCQPYLLGIIAETRFAPIKTDNGEKINSFAGLGLAFDASTVKETIELFFN